MIHSDYGDIESEESAAEILDLFEMNKRNLPLLVAFSTASSSCTLQKATVKGTELSNGEDDTEYFEEDEDGRSDAEETNTEAFTVDQQSR